MMASEMAKSLGSLEDLQVVEKIRRMERDRASWMNSMVEANSLNAKIKKLFGQELAAVGAAKQMYEVQKFQEESIRKMLDPLEKIRSSLLADGSIQRMIDELFKPLAATDHFTKLANQEFIPGDYLCNLQLGADNSIEHARKLLAEPSVSTGLQHFMKSFEKANKCWPVPPALLESISPLKALQEKFGKLSLPVMDFASASTLANILGREGIELQLSAFGINSDGSLKSDFDVQEDGIGLSRKSMELMTLLSFIFAFLIPIYQECSSAQWQASVDKRLEAQSDAMESQRKKIEALTNLVEKALIKESERQGDRFVVRDRVAVVRDKPEHGSTVVGKLFPQEVVRPISEDGKWIEFEYYHWLHQEYRTGWSLKKYFQRVSRLDPVS